MKIFRLLTIVFLVVLCVAVYAGDVCSVSYDQNGNMKLRAGLAIDGQVRVSSPGGWYFKYEKDSLIYLTAYPSWGDGWSFVDNGATWNCAGRWFVTGAHDKGSIDYHYSDVSDIPDIAKSINNGIRMDYTPMFTSTIWSVGSVFTSGTNLEGCSPAGKFCLFRVRVTDNGGANERYYWVGDSETGSFTYYKEWIDKNFQNLPEKGKYGEYGEAVWNIKEENIDVYIKVNTIYDQARFEVNLVNNGNSGKYVSLGMYGATTSTNNICSTWGYKPYCKWDEIYDKDGKLVGFSNTYEADHYGEDVSEANRTYFYIPGMGTILEPIVLKKNSIPNRLEMYNYRWTNADAVQGINASTRIDADIEDEEKIDSMYNLPPKSSYLDVNNWGYKSVGSTTAFQSVAQATFDNVGDATKPDYLIIDNSSNMLQYTTIRDHKFPFGSFSAETYGTTDFIISPDDGNFPVETYWPKDEKGVKKPYEDTLLKSKLMPYEDNFKDPMTYMAVWGSSLLSPGKSKQIVTYYGAGGKSFINGALNGKVFTRHYHSFFVESPTTLNYSVLDSSFGLDSITPNQFVIHPVVSNQGAVRRVFDFKINRVEITLPDGLDLADDYDGDGDYFETTEDFNTYVVNKNGIIIRENGAYENMSIKIQANGLFSGNLKYTVRLYGEDLSGGGEWCQEVSREIFVPTTKTGYIYSGPGNIVGSPFKNFNTSLPLTISSIYGDDAVGFKWVTGDSNSVDQGHYELIDDFSDLNDQNLGFWVIKGFDEDSSTLFNYTYPSELKPKDVNYGDIESVKRYMAGMTITLKPGWNIVTNPYIYSMQWTKVLVKNIKNGDIKLMTDAVDAGWISKSMFSFEPEKGSDGSMIPEKSKYLSYPTISVMLIPNKGYWLYSYKDVVLYVDPAMYPNSKIYDDEWFSDPDKYFMMGYRTDENFE